MLSSKTKEYYLLLAGAATIIIFLLLPANKSWFEQKVVASWRNFPTQKDFMYEEQRKLFRFGNYYRLSKQVANTLTQKAGKEDILLLVPPSLYFKQNGIDFRVPEPAVFYYFTGIKTIRANSPDALKANWFIRVENKQVIIDKVTAGINLPDTIAAFNKYPITL